MDILADFEEVLGWPPDAWKTMGWGEFWARRRHLVRRMTDRQREQERLARRHRRAQFAG